MRAEMRERLELVREAMLRPGKRGHVSAVLEALHAPALRLTKEFKPDDEHDHAPEKEGGIHAAGI